MVCGLVAGVARGGEIAIGLGKGCVVLRLDCLVQVLKRLSSYGCNHALQRNFVFHGVSATEAIEGALKIARAYAQVHNTNGSGPKWRIIALDNSFHGRTYGALSVTGQKKYRAPFEPVVPGSETLNSVHMPTRGNRLAVWDILTAETPRATGEDGRWTIEMMHGIYASHLSGKRLSLPLVDRRHPLAPTA